jgi:hypothetical protein
MHVGANPDDGTTLDAAALPRLIPILRARGYRFVTLHALLASAGALINTSREWCIAGPSGAKYRTTRRVSAPLAGNYRMP